MSKRVKRSNALQWFAIGALLFAGASHVCVAQNKLEGVVDTNYKNATTILSMKETNDCAVRAISEAYDITYLNAHGILKSWGREDKDGVYWKDLEEGIRKDFPFSAGELISIHRYITAFTFVEQIAECGYTYIIVADKHIFVIEEEFDQHWLVKGNMNDATKQILGYLKIKQ
jgi:hypothetical protein